jgi:hypothetical protein
VSKLLPLLVAETGLSELDLLRIIQNAPVRYKTYAIAKRDNGTRIISQPARELKALQRILSQQLLANLPIHDAAMAYREGRSIRHNALAHAGNGPILKFDFKDFFPSIKGRDWRLFCEKHELFSDPHDIWISTNIFFYKSSRSAILRLAIGAPSSPILSNVLMNEFDERLTNLVAKDQVTYTRYADDLTFSAKRTGYLTGVEAAILSTLKEIRSPSLFINDSKTVLATRKYKRFVTGLVLTNDGSVSLGHERKRKIRAGVHNESLGKLSAEDRASLAGMLAFAHDVEPLFVAKLEKKYGSPVIQSLKSRKRSR